MNNFDRAEELMQSLRPIVRKIIEEETRNCFRTYKARVVTAPNLNTKKCIIQLVGQETTLSLPYSSAVSNVTAGSMVWIAIINNSWKNAIVWQKIDFK